jgi:hypothetical protein
MPYCPVCRGEYREGYTHCQKCDADLVDELPPPSQHQHSIESLPTPIQSFVLSWIDAWRTVAAASLRGWQVFRSARTLVWLMVAVVALSTALTLAGNLITYTATDFGRRVVALPEGLPATEDPSTRPSFVFPWRMLRPRLATQQFSGGVSGLSLQGALYPLWEMMLPSRPAYQSVKDILQDQLRILPYAVIASVLELLIIAYWVAAMLAALKRRVISQPEGSETSFFGAGSRYWHRIAVLYAAVWVILLLTSLPWFFLFPEGRSSMSFSLQRVVSVVVELLVAFAPTIILVDNVSAWESVRRNVGFLVGHWREAVLFLLLLSVARWVLMIPAAVVSALGSPLGSTHGHTLFELTLGAVPFGYVRNLALGVLSLWFAATAMVWYMGKPAPADPFSRSGWYGASARDAAGSEDVTPA